MSNITTKEKYLFIRKFFKTAAVIKKKYKNAEIKIGVRLCLSYTIPFQIFHFRQDGKDTVNHVYF